MAGLFNRLYAMLSGSRTNRTAEAKKTTGRRRLKMEMLENRFPMDATISGVVFNDLNGNSVQLGAGEVGIGGVTLQLFNDVNSNQTYEAGTDTLVGTATSSAVPATLGNYSFNVPAAGRYLVRQTPTPGFAQLSTQRTQAVEITALEFAQSTIITTIDTFDVQPQLISVLTTNPITDSATDAGILGTERDTFKLVLIRETTTCCAFQQTVAPQESRVSSMTGTGLPMLTFHLRMEPLRLQ